MDNNETIEDQDFKIAILIQLSRIYDMLALIASPDQKQKVQQLIDLHRQGQFYAPPPSMRIEE